mgnify:CR=1 FL=1
MKIKGEVRANMDTGRGIGVPYEVEWVRFAGSGEANSTFRDSE